MPAGSPTSDKYVVYTVEPDGSCSTIPNDGHIVFKDPDCNSLHENEKEHFKQLPVARSFSASSSAKWGSYWSKRERCCCVWNLFLMVTVIAISTIFVLVHKNILELSPPPFSNSTPDATSDAIAFTTTTTHAVTTKPRETCTSPGCIRLAAEILSRMNTAVDPCEDFYEYSCGGYMKDTYLSWERPRIRDNPDVVNDKYSAYLKDQFSTPQSEKNERVVKNIKDFYHSCLNFANVPEQAYQQHFQSLADELYKEDFNKLLMRSVFEFGGSPFFKVIVWSNSVISVINRFSDNIITEFLENGEIVPSFRYLMPSDLYYRFKATDKVMIAYRTFVRRAVLAIFGVNRTNTTESLIRSLDDILEFEVLLNQMWYKTSLRTVSEDMQVCTKTVNISTLQTKYNTYGIDWLSFFKFGLKKNINSSFLLCHEELSEDVAYIIANTNENVLRNYVILHTLLNTDLYSALSFKVPVFAVSSSIYNKYRHTPMNQEVKCVQIIKQLIPVSSIFVSKGRDKFIVETEFLKIILKKVLQETISDLYWIPNEQRNALRNYINDININYEWTVWSNSTYNDSLNNLNISADFVKNTKQLINLKNEWYLEGYKVKYSGSEVLSDLNTWKKVLEISASALQSPMFYSSSTIPVMYGSTGSLIAQALTKAFDINALMQHLMNGVIDQRVAYTLAHHFQCLIDTFSQYSIEDQSGKLNQIRGDLTKSENFRDIVALLISNIAFKKAYYKSNERVDLPGVNFTDSQLFYVTYGQTLCEKINRRGVELYYIGDNGNIHLPSKFRIQGTLSNFADFARSFGCQKDTTYNPTKRCTLF